MVRDAKRFYAFCDAQILINDLHKIITLNEI